MNLDFGQVPPLTTELAALERLKNRCHHVISVDIDPIFFKLAGNKDMHNIMNEFEFRLDRTTDYGVSCPWASKKYPHRLIMGKMVFPLFLCCFWIGSFWYFHVTRTSIKAWMSSNFRQIRLLTTELAALESLKHQCLHFFSAGIDPILFKVGGYIDMHNILHEFEFWPNGTTDYGVSCPDGSQVSDRCPLGYLFTLSVMIQISCALLLCKMENLTVTFCYLWLTENFGSRHSHPEPPLKH